MKDLGFRFIFNLSYSPDFNPIETVFSKVKLRYLKLRLEKLVADGNQLSSEEMIQDALSFVTPTRCANAVKLARWHMH